LISWETDILRSNCCWMEQIDGFS